MKRIFLIIVMLEAVAMKIFRLSSALIAVIALLCSCSVDDSYTFDNYDTEMTFFKNGLNLPLGSTAPIPMDSLLALTKNTKFMSHLKTDENGNFYFGYSDKLLLTHQSPGIQGQTLPELEDSRTESFGKIPIAIRNVEWEVEPVITVTISTNLDLPAAGELVFTPYPREKEAVTVRDITIPISENPDKTASTTMTVRDIPGLFRTLPDSMAVSFKVSAAGHSPMTPGASYSIQTDYNIEVPLIFGKDVQINPMPSLFPLPEEIHDIVSNNPFGMEADVLSTLPVDTCLKFSLIDSKGREVELASECIIRIPGTGPDMDPEPSHVSTIMRVKDKGIVPTVLRIDYELNVPGNMWIRKNQFIRLSNITLVLPEGITVS